MHRELRQKHSKNSKIQPQTDNTTAALNTNDQQLPLIVKYDTLLKFLNPNKTPDPA